MNVIRRLFGGTTQPARSSQLEVFPIHYPNDTTPTAVRCLRTADPDEVVRALNLPVPLPTIFISGGAGGMDTDSQAVTRSTIEDGLARFAHERKITLIDGGTSGGVMALIGLARHRRKYTFPLVGVAPDSVVYYPGHTPANRMADLDAFHSHFVLVDGTDFGAESEMLVQLARSSSGRGAKKMLGFIVNGGEIVRKEIHHTAVTYPEIPLLVLEGSGRFADELAAAKRAGGSTDQRVSEILEQDNVHLISIKAGADTLRRWLEAYFGY
ncbi:MAG: hypothetical protein IAE80_22725 [Anaerolinea sp.]|nr:hypothetical protein [Anaerolinea sp.]